MTVVHSLVIIFSVVFLGMICHKRQIFTQVHMEGFERFLFKIALPSYLFTSILECDLQALINVDYIVSYVLSFICVTGSVFLVFYKSADLQALCIRALAAGYVNAAIYALPIITLLLKDPTAAVLSNILQIIIIQSIFVLMLNFIHHKEKSVFKKLISTFSTPLILMPIFALVCNALAIDLPTALTQSIKSLGSSASSIALFTFGLTLGGVKIAKADIDQNLCIIVVIKNILHPLISWCIGYGMKLEPYWFYSLIISSSAPTAFVVYLMAKQFSTQQELVKRVIAVSSAASLISLILIVCLLA